MRRNDACTGESPLNPTSSLTRSARYGSTPTTPSNCAISTRHGHIDAHPQPVSGAPTTGINPPDRWPKPHGATSSESSVGRRKDRSACSRRFGVGGGCSTPSPSSSCGTAKRQRADSAAPRRRDPRGHQHPVEGTDPVPPDPWTPPTTASPPSSTRRCTCRRFWAWTTATNSPFRIATTRWRWTSTLLTQRPRNPSHQTSTPTSPSDAPAPRRFAAVSAVPDASSQRGHPPPSRPTMGQRRTRRRPPKRRLGRPRQSVSPIKETP